MIHYYIIMNHQKFREINQEKNDDFIDEDIATTTKSMPKVDLFKF